MSLTHQAQHLVNGERAEAYGDINESFTRIAGLWSSYTGIQLDKYDVAKMMVLLKISRAKNSNHRDSFIDVVGYIECIDQLLKIDERNNNEN